MSSPEHAPNAGLTPAIRLVPAEPVDALERVEALVESYRGLADVFHELLAEEGLDALLDRIAETVGALVPYHELVIFEADLARRKLIPVLVRSEWAQEIENDETSFGVGITGWAVEHREPVHTNAAHLDPRVRIVPGTPVDPEALIVVPLIARGSLKGALNIYRVGADAEFDADEFELAKRFGDAAALALDNAQIRARLEHLAQTDSLTGLFNHRYFHERLRAELQRASRIRLPVGVLMLDIDDFKRVNDIHGHATGDAVLVELAQTLLACARGSDVVCRIGGEEFAVIMPGTDSRSAAHLAGRISEHVKGLEFNGAGALSLSIGFAEGPADASNPRELVARAESAMMTAKARGKNQLVDYGEGGHERPQIGDLLERDVRSIAHLKLLQRLSGELNRLNDVREVGLTIANELRALIDYHNCRVYAVEGDMVVPIAFRGDLSADERSVDVFKVKVGEGITGHVVATGRPILSGDASTCEFGKLVPGTQAIDESLLAVPMRYGSRTLGAIVISKLGFDQFDDDDLRLLEVLAGQAAVALENARLYEAQRREADTAKALLGAARELATARGLEDLLSRIVAQATALVGSEHTSFWIEESLGGRLVQRAQHGDGHEGLQLPLEAFPQDEPFVHETDDRAYAVAPLAFDDGTRACIVALLDRNEDGASERPLGLLAGLAHQAKLAVANAISFESLQGTFISTVEALATALESNAEYTSSSARWIADAALAVGRELGAGEQTLTRLELGALFHDIGKIGIPSDLLAKAERLSHDEEELVRTNPELGARIVGLIEPLEDVKAIVRHSHERWDGLGYPDGLAGERIPIESRIVFVCGAFHAMTTDRPHRSRLSNDDACRRLQDGAGAEFDPRVVEVFVGLVDAGVVRPA